MRHHFPLLALAVLAASPARATNWTFLTRGGDGALISLDLETVQAKDGWVRVWVQYDFTRVRARPERGLVLLQEINCNGRYARIVTSRFYAPDGRVSAEDTRPGAYAEVIPGSVNERIGKRVCALGATRTGD